jgi:hypothetical protein
MAVTPKLAAVLVAVLVAAGAPATASASGTPGDQPLPGHTIENPPLPPVLVDGRPTTVKQGVASHAGYVVEVPPGWNGELVMWAHGYRGTGTVLTVDAPAYGMRQHLLERGYAWAASSYYANGYDVRAGVTTTRELADLFGRLVHRPERVFIAGVSMGGHVIGRSLEQYPGYYAGALPMCGVLGDHELFDFLLDHQLVSQDLADLPAYPLPPDYLTSVVPRIQQRLGLVGLTPGGPDTTNDLGKQLRAVIVERSGGPRPGAEAAFAHWKDFLYALGASGSGGELAENPGQLATNLTTRYRPSRPVDLNRTVRRVAPENVRARLTPALTPVPQIAGRPSAPVLSLHDLGDLFVPFSMEQEYREDVARNGRTGLLAQRAIRAVEHCEFSAGEVRTAFDDLVRWVDTGRRAAGDVVDDRRALAAADYGCRFTDRTATGGTRGLFAPCP